MKFGLSLPPFGEFADPHYLMSTAATAEAAGWDGFFIWDHVVMDTSTHSIPSPIVALAAVALATHTMHVGVMVTSLARRRPWNFARETVTLDHLSNGRLIVGVGLGGSAQGDYGWFGEETNDKIRAEKLDEGLQIVNGLWSGQPFGYQGAHYQMAEVTFQPTPAQSPRIPIWVGGRWDKHKPMRRAARWDGYFPLKWGEILTPDEWRSIMDYVNRHRQATTPCDWIHGGTTPGDDPTRGAEIVQPYAEIGITWWVENIDPWTYGWSWEDAWNPEMTERMNQRIRQGPPRLTG